MEQAAKRVIINYARAYNQLYNRMPNDLRILNADWVIVNGARMKVTELEYLTKRLQQEYVQGLEQRRSVVSRLIRWFKG